MAQSGEVTHLFAEFTSLDELGSLLGRSTRLKYTCLSVSKKYLALGSNSGGVYIFNRDTLKYLQVVFGGTEASLVVSVSLSPSDQHVAIALSTGHVAVYELKLERRAKPERVRYTQEHVGNTITALTWDESSSKLFVGDSVGNVSIIVVPTNKSKTLFTISSEVIAHVETAVYQMEWWKDKLLVSTVTHTHLFDTTKRSFSTIGTKSRNGEYGSCFYVEPSSKYTVIYCARPGSRIWEVDFEGTVLNTHQLKQLLTVPPIPVIILGNEHFELVTTPHTSQSVSFYKMFHISQYIITWSSKGLYLFDPINVKVMIWTQSYKGIKDMCVYNNDVYLFLENSSVHRLTLLPIYQLFAVLSSRGLWSLSSSLLLAADQIGIRQAVVKRIKKDLLQNILTGLKLEGKNDTAEKVKASMEDVSEGSIESFEAEDDLMNSAEVKGHTYLPSGMVIVSEGVQVKRLWDKKDARMTILDKLETAGSMGISNANGQKYAHEKNSEFQSKVDQINTFDSNEYTGEGTNNSNRYEQIKNSDLFNENKIEDDNKASSSVVNSFENIGLDFDKSFDGEVVHLKNDHLFAHVSTDDKFDNSGNVNKMFDNLFTRVDYLAQVSGAISSFQESDHMNKISPSDLIVHHSFNKDSNISSGDSELRRNMEAPHDADLSPHHSIVDNLNSTVELQFNIQAVNYEDYIKCTRQNTAAEFCNNSTEVIHAVSQSQMFGDGNSDLSASVNTSFIYPVLTSTDTKSYCGISYPTESVSYFSGEKSAEFSHHLQVDTVKHNIVTVSYSDIISEAKLQPTYSELEMTRSVEQSEKFQENSSKISPSDNTQADVTINAMVALNNEDQNSSSNSQPRLLPSLTLLHTDSDIAKPVKVSRKKRKTINGGIRSISVDMDSAKINIAKTLRKAVSYEDEHAHPFMQGLDLEMDNISIATISSVEEEDSVASPDSLSAAGDLDVREHAVIQILSSDLSITPPENIGKTLSRRSSTSSTHEERRSEVIPPLIDRLAAARGSVNSDDLFPGFHQESAYGSPQSGSGDHFLPVGSPKASLSALKDGLSLKLKTQTKSIIKTLQEKNLLTKPSNTPVFSQTSSQQQFEKSPKDSVSQHTHSTVEVNVADELSRAKNLAITSANITDLCICALDIQKKLRSSVVVNPVELRKVLNEWATQLNLAVCRYHKELSKKTNEIQWKEQEFHPLSKISQHTEEIDRNNELKSVQYAGSSNGVVVEFSNPALSQENQNTSGSYTFMNSNLGSESARSSLELITTNLKSLSPTYWASVTHSDDPFQLPKKHLDLFRTLTTMCFVCGVSGDILNHLHFTEDMHYKTFVELVLPPSINSLFSPDYDCLMSLFPDSHISCKEHNHLQISNNIGTESKRENKQNHSSAAVYLNDIFHSSATIAKDDQNISQESFNDLPLHHETENQNDVGHEQISITCSCRSNLGMWSENEQFKQDISLALFVRLFFFALDYEQVKQALDNHNMMFLTWTSLVLCSREIGSGDIVSSILIDKQINPAINYLRSGILPRQSALFGHIYKLFELSPLKTSELCGEMWKIVSPVDLVQFSLLCLKPATSCILRYFKQAMMHSAAVMRPDVFRHLCKHKDVRYLLFKALLQSQSNNVPVDEIKSQANQSLKAVLPLDWLNILLSMIASENERDRVVQFSAANGSMAVCVKLLTESDQWQKLLQLIVDFNNINLLRGKHGEDGYIPRNEQEWRFLLKCFHSKWSTPISTLASQKKFINVGSGSNDAQTSGQPPSDRLSSSTSDFLTDSSASNIGNETTHYTIVKDANLLPTEMSGTKPEDLSFQYQSFSSKSNQDDLGQDNSITWQSLGYLLLEHVGGATAIDLLMEHLSDPVLVKNCLKAEFLKACYLDFSIKMEQNHVIHDILEKLSIHMWKKRPDFVPSSVFHSISAEKKLSENGEWEDVAIQRLVKTLENADVMSKHLGSQWGQEINTSSICQCCHIPLKSVMTLTIQGVIIFPCGHAFHKTCVSSPTCPVIH